MDIKFLTQENEIQKLYSKFGLVVPVGDLSNTKAPAVSVNNITILDEPFYYPEETEPTSQRTAEFELNVLTGAPEYNIVMCAYPKSVIDNCSEFQDGVVPTDFDLDDAINNPDSQSCLHTANAAIFCIPSQRGYNHYKAPFYDGSDYGEYILIVSSYSYTEPYPFYTTTYSFNYEAPANWATADEVLEGNKFIGEDGQEAVGTYVPESGPSNYLELQWLMTGWEDKYQDKHPFGGYLTLNLNDLTIPEGGTYSGNTPQDWVADMEFLQCYLDAQHNNFFNVDCTSYNGILNAPRSLGNAFITSDGTVIIPCIGGSYDPDPDTGEQTIPIYDNIPCDQTDLTGDFEVYAVTSLDAAMTPMYEVVATGTYFIPATQVCE